MFPLIFHSFHCFWVSVQTSWGLLGIWQPRTILKKPQTHWSSVTLTRLGQSTEGTQAHVPYAAGLPVPLSPTLPIYVISTVTLLEPSKEPKTGRPGSYLEFLALTFLTGKWWPGVELGLIPQLLTCSPQFAPPPLFFPSLLLPSLPVGAPPGHLCYKTLACRLTSVYNHPLTTVAWITLRRVALGETLGLFRLTSPGFESRTLHHERKELAYNGHGLPDSQTPCPVEGGTARAGHN